MSKNMRFRWCRVLVIRVEMAEDHFGIDLT